MRTETTDPITGNDVKDIENAPFVVEGEGKDALKIYFESDQNKQTYLDVEMGGPKDDLINVYNKTTKAGGEMEM